MKILLKASCSPFSFYIMNLFLELRRHGKLAAKRSPIYEKSKFGKIWMWLMGIFWAGYLIFFGVTIAQALKGESREPYQILNGVLPVILFLDFLIRIPFQRTPTQEIKPYLLLPVKRVRLIDFLLIRSGVATFNLFWLFFFVPFSLLTVFKYYALAGVLTYCIGIWLLMIINNYWYLLCRTLINEHLWWIFLPIAGFAALAAVMLVPDSPVFFIDLGEGLVTGNLLIFIAVLLVIAVMWWINRSVMIRLVYQELSKVEDVKVKHISEYKFLDRYGEVGEYMRLELKMLLRNKVPKTSLRAITAIVLVFTLLLSFSDVYQGGYMKSFILIYNYAIFGILFLTHIMSYEGNYIDGLMSRKESIYTLLRAKYILYSAALLIPFVLMLPAIFTGQITLLSSIAWMLFTSGAIYCCLFQLAVYNNKTTDLNARLSGRQNVGTGTQNLISMLALGVPLVLNYLLLQFCGQTLADWILIAIGAAFILTSGYWQKNVYARLMARRYQNMEGFRDSRQH
jgi:hypothetical protein